jgi:hypothetical protein
MLGLHLLCLRTYICFLIWSGSPQEECMHKSLCMIGDIPHPILHHVAMARSCVWMLSILPRVLLTVVLDCRSCTKISPRLSNPQMWVSLGQIRWTMSASLFLLVKGTVDQYSSHPPSKCMRDVLTDAQFCIW